jgi:chitodextrinase
MKKWSSWLVGLTMLLLPGVAFAASQPAPAGYAANQIIFEDTFTSPALDATKWNPWLGDDNFGRWGDNGQLPSPYSGSNCDATCSGTDQIMYYDPFPYGSPTNLSGNHLVGGNGNLAIIAAPNSHFSNLGYSWVAAGVTTYGKAYLPATGGYVQWHAKMPDSRYGAWSGLWLLSKGGAEMDIQESGYPWGSTPVNQVLASHWQGTGGSQIIQDTGVDLSAAYHTYGIEYKPGVSWKVYLDGKLMATYTAGVPTNAPYQVLIDFEIAGPLTTGWHTVADPVNHPGPFELDVDDVQIYSSAIAPAGDTTPPTVPANVTATLVSGSEIDLAWTASTDNTSVYGYDVYRNGAYLGFSATPNYKDTTVVAGTTYSYQVLAYDPARNVSAFSVALVVTATTADTTAPSVPAGVVATVINSLEIDLKWTAATDNVGVTGYNVYRNGVLIGTSATNSYADKTTVANTTYSYSVAAFDAAKNLSAQSAAVSATTPNFASAGPVVTLGSVNVMSRAGRGVTVCTQPANVNGTILSTSHTVSGQVWWWVGFVSGCSGWVPQSSLGIN